MDYFPRDGNGFHSKNMHNNIGLTQDSREVNITPLPSGRFPIGIDIARQDLADEPQFGEE
jgi:hypothetical protein